MCTARFWNHCMPLVCCDSDPSKHGILVYNLQQFRYQISCARHVSGIIVCRSCVVTVILQNMVYWYIILQNMVYWYIIFNNVDIKYSAYEKFLESLYDVRVLSVILHKHGILVYNLQQCRYQISCARHVSALYDVCCDSDFWNHCMCARFWNHSCVVTVILQNMVYWYIIFNNLDIKYSANEK